MCSCIALKDTFNKMYFLKEPITLLGLEILCHKINHSHCVLY